MSNEAETDTESYTSGQQSQVQPAGQAQQPPAWFTDPQQQAIMAHYQKLGFDGHILHEMNRIAQGGNKDVTEHLKSVFGSLPDPEMTAWIDAQQTQREIASRKATVISTQLQPQGGPSVTGKPVPAAPVPANTAQAHVRQLAQGQAQQMRQLAAQSPQQALQQQRARYAQTMAQDPVEQEFLKHVITVKPGTFATPAEDVVPAAQLPKAIKQRLDALAQKHGVQAFGVGTKGWSPELEKRMVAMLSQGQQEAQSNWTTKDKSDIAAAKAGSQEK